MNSECVDRELFRDVIGRFATGVAVITTRHGGADFGMTASAVTSVSLEPPMITVCLNRAMPTQQAIVQAGGFAVNVLSEEQGELARRFGSPMKDKFEGVPLRRGRSGAPLLEHALAHLECVVVNDVEGGTHSVFLAEVHEASGESGAPLAYFRGQFGRLELEHDEAVHAELRGLVLSRALPHGTILDPAKLSDELRAEASAVFHALSRLCAAGLLTRDPERGYVVTPLDVATLDAAIRAREVIETGAVSQVGDRLSGADLDELRGLMEATEPQFHGAPHLDGDAYFQANKAFHERFVELAGGPPLLSAYRRLNIDGLLLRSFATAPSVGDDTIDDHREIVEALEAADPEAARAAIHRHNVNVARLSREALCDAGGRI